MSQWLYKLTADEPKIRLFCFPYAGGGTIPYRRWRPDLDPSIEQCVFNYPGREARIKESALTKFSEFIDELYAVIKAELNMPYAFYGHSYGGMVAYIIACKLQQDNAKMPKHFIVSGRRAPHLPEPRVVANLPRDEFIDYLDQTYQGIPKIVMQRRELLNLFIPIVEADFKLYQDYHEHVEEYPFAKLTCPMTCVAYEQDAISPNDIAQWQEECQQKIDFIKLPGKHFELLENWRPLVAVINQILV